MNEEASTPAGPGAGSVVGADAASLAAVLDAGVVSGMPGVRTLAGAPEPVMALRAVGDVEVLREIDRLLVWSQANHSRIGFFSALYWHVATGVGRALENHDFQHPDWVDELDGVFFKRYLVAINHFRRADPNDPAMASWDVSFDAAAETDFIVVQHLLLGANAHINFDLSIAVAEAIGAERMPAFRQDYEFLNQVFKGVIVTVVGNISRFSRVLRWFGWIAGRGEDQVIGFSLKLARDGAWRAAQRLATMTPDERRQAIADRDAAVADIALIVERPGFPASLLVGLIRRLERRNVNRIIHDLLLTGGGT